MASILCFLVVLAAPVAYMVSMGQPFLRSTGLPLFGLAAVGAIGTIVAARGGKAWRKVLAVLAILLCGAFVYGFFVFAKLPPQTQGAPLATAPDLSLPDSEGRQHRLSEAAARGPVLLVFYRGYW